MSSMAKSGEIGNREPQENINFPRDLLHRFMFNNHLSQKSQQNSEEDEGELELSLGLSLNGRFGVDPKAQKLTRSSSIPEFLTNHLENDNNETSCGFPMASVPLVRTSSLPTETEEEWRRRKELQTLRRMEAKRKRSEKQRSLKVARSRTSHSVEEYCEEEKRDEVVNGNSPSRGRGTCVLDVRAEKAIDLHQGVGVSQVSSIFFSKKR